MKKVYISNRKENLVELNNLYEELFSRNKNIEKIEAFKDLCIKSNNFVPSPRCKGKKCVLGKQCGYLDADIMFIAEAPGRNGAERTGVPVYGDPSGDNFENILNKASYGYIGRRDVYITNAFLWNPTNDSGNNDRPTKEELALSSFLLQKQIDLVQPKLILALGRVAFASLDYLSPIKYTNVPLKYLAGKVFMWKNNIQVGVLYHPSPRVLNTHRSFEDMVKDLRKALKTFYGYER